MSSPRIPEHTDYKDSAHEVLSPQELDVFRRLSVGERVTDIATAMALSVKTVSTYRSRILEKMNFSNNAEITLYAVRAGLLTPEGATR